MSSMWTAIQIAYDKGYRVTECGSLIGLSGLPLKINKRGSQRYPTFSVNVGGLTKSGVYGIPVHKFAAFCFYGESVKKFQCVRHLNGNTLDVSKNNILLGTHSENEKDKSAEVRSASAKSARTAQGYRALNSKFSDDQVRYIRSCYPDKTYQQIADEFKVTKQCIYLIVKRKNYIDIN